MTSQPPAESTESLESAESLESVEPPESPAVEPIATPISPPFFDRVRDFLLGHPDGPAEAGQRLPAADDPSPAQDPQP